MQTSARIIAHSSFSSQNSDLITYELIYPRIIHSELMTHRVFSRNAASSRAIPVKVMNKTIVDNIAMPYRFGANQSGMQDKGEDYEKRIFGIFKPKTFWKLAVRSSVFFSNAFDSAGYHKQVCNRLTEAGQYMKVVVTATSFDNWFNLRNHADADPTIMKLASLMLIEYCKSTPYILGKGEWHTPYYRDGYWDGSQEETLEEALKISASCCAQTSYRKSDDTLEKAERVYSRLVESAPVHASPTEHQGTPIVDSEECDNTEAYKLFNLGITGTYFTHDSVGYVSGNFRDWIQFRQTIPNHDCWKYEGITN